MPISNTSDDFMLWFAGVGGGDALVLLGGDPGTGGGNTATTIATILNGDPNLWAPRDIMLDTVHDKFFFVDSDLAGHNRILQGSISQLLANPGAPVFTTIYQNTASGANSAIRALILDPEHGQVFFDQGTTFNRVNYDTPLQSATTLANLGAGNFITQMAIDFATGEVFLGSSRVASVFGQDVVEDNFIYRAAGLTPASASLTFAKLPFSPNDTAFGDPDVPPVPGNAFPQELGVVRGMDYDPATHTLYISTATVTLDTSTDQDGSEFTTYYGGVFAYSTVGNPTGTYTTIYQQDGTTGPVGLLGFIEVDPATGKYFVVDTTGGPAAGDGGVWVGSLSGGTPTLFATIGNPGNLGPQGLDIIHAPTLTGVETGASAVETVGPGSGYSLAVQPFASIAASDLDSAAFTDQLRGAQVRISGGFNSAPGSNEQLTILGTTSGTLGSGISYSYNSLTGVMTLTGVNTFDNYEAALALVSYSIDGDNPDANGSAPTRTVSFSLFDGLLYSDEFDTTVNIVGTNDAPVNTTGGAVATNEDAAAVAVPGLSVSDVDNGSLTVTLAVGDGTLTLGSTAGLSFSTGDGSGDATMTFSGTTADINAALAGLSYTPDPNFNGPDTLTFTSDDGTAQDVDLVAISVAPVNDAPQGTDNTITILEDNGYIFSAADFGFSDPVESDGFAGLIVSTLPSAGTLYVNGSPVLVPGTFVSAADIALGLFTYTPGANGNGVGYDNFTFQVRDTGGTLNGGVDTDQTPNTITFDVTPDNDDPVNTTPGPVAASEDASVVVSGLSVSDVDSASLTVTLSVARGTLLVDTGVAGGVTAGQVTGNGTGSVTLSGTQAEINTTLAAAAGLTYTPTPNVNGPDTLNVSTSDGFGNDSDNIAVNVAAVNDAPTVAGDGTEDAAPIPQDTPSPVGQTVASLFGGQYSDATDQVAGGSSADAFAGVAVTANGSGAAGQWQYFDGVSWVNIGPASDGAAVLLSASTSIRFNPAPGFTGSAPTLTVHLVDASGGAIVSGSVVDASVTGGTTRYSTGTVVLSENVFATNTAPTGVTGTLSVQEVSANGTLVGTLVAADPDSSTFTYTLVNDAGGRFDINSSTGAVTVENGLLLDYEQNASHTIRVRVDDNEGGISEFDVNVTVTDRHGELVIGDGNNHTYYGGAETDILIGGHGSDVIRGGGGIDIITGGNLLFDPTDAGDQLFGEGGSDIITGNGGDDVIAGGADGDVLAGEDGSDTIYGGASANDATASGNDVISGDAGNDFLYGNDGNDQLDGGNDNDQLFGGAGTDELNGGSGVDRLDGGAGADDLTGGSGFDVFVFRKGQANGDHILDFDGNGSGAGDTIRLEGYAAGTTFSRVSGDLWRINDHGSIEYVTINSDGNVHSSDWAFFP